MAWLARWSILLIGGALIIVALVVAWIWHNHEVAKNAAAPAQAHAQVEKANSENAHDAIGVIVDHDKADKVTDDTTREHNAIIHKTPGASTGIDPALDAAGRNAICMHKSAAHLPECRQLLQPHPQ